MAILMQMPHTVDAKLLGQLIEWNQIAKGASSKDNYHGLVLLQSKIKASVSGNVKIALSHVFKSPSFNNTKWLVNHVEQLDKLQLTTLEPQINFITLCKDLSDKVEQYMELKDTAPRSYSMIALRKRLFEASSIEEAKKIARQLFSALERNTLEQSFESALEGIFKQPDLDNLIWLGDNIGKVNDANLANLAKKYPYQIEVVRFWVQCKEKVKKYKDDFSVKPHLVVEYLLDLSKVTSIEQARKIETEMGRLLAIYISSHLRIDECPAPKASAETEVKGDQTVRPTFLLGSLYRKLLRADSLEKMKALGAQIKTVVEIYHDISESCERCLSSKIISGSEDFAEAKANLQKWVLALTRVDDEDEVMTKLEDFKDQILKQLLRSFIKACFQEYKQKGNPGFLGNSRMTALLEDIDSAASLQAAEEVVRTFIDTGTLSSMQQATLRTEPGKWLASTFGGRASRAEKESSLRSIVKVAFQEYQKQFNKSEQDASPGPV